MKKKPRIYREKKTEKKTDIPNVKKNKIKHEMYATGTCQGHNEGGKEAQLPGLRITMGTPNH